MTKTELIELVAKQIGIPKNRSNDIIDAIIQVMKDALLEDERIELRGFGTFSTRHYAPKKGRNPSTGETLHVKGKRSVHFKAGKGLRERVDYDEEQEGAQKQKPEQAKQPKEQTQQPAEETPKK